MSHPSSAAHASPPKGKISNKGWETHFVPRKNLKMVALDWQNHHVSPYQVLPPFNRLIPNVLPRKPTILDSAEPMRIKGLGALQHDCLDAGLLLRGESRRIVLTEHASAVLEFAEEVRVRG